MTTVSNQRSVQEAAPATTDACDRTETAALDLAFAELAAGCYLDGEAAKQWLKAWARGERPSLPRSPTDAARS